MAAKKSDIAKDGYRSKTGSHGKGHKFSGGVRGTATIAAKQRNGGPNHGGMPPRRGFPSLPMGG